MRRAIMQSGGGTAAFIPEQAARVAAAVFDVLGVDACPVPISPFERELGGGVRLLDGIR